MVSQFFKKQSKRVKTRLRQKIKKKVRDHKKKVRKNAKRNPCKRLHKRKIPGVPNSLPFKEEILQEAEARKIRAQEEQRRLQELRKEQRMELFNKNRNLENLVSDAEKRTEDFNRKGNATTDKVTSYTGGRSVENSLKTFYKEFKKVINSADVVLQVLDARDPLGTRCKEVEEAVINAGVNKKLVLVLNKIDLVPKENVESWLKYLRNEFPTVAFKASTQKQKKKLCQTRLKLAGLSRKLQRSSHCLGANLMMRLLGSYSRNQGIKTVIRVGVVGLPNTGKSSIINSLKRSRACKVGTIPGITREMKEVFLTKNIKLLDSPGVVMLEKPTDTSLILRNCVSICSIMDPIKPLKAILKRCNKEQLMLHYKIPNYNNIDEFLSVFSMRKGLLKKGGRPLKSKMARFVLLDWVEGKISYYTHPPEQHTLSTHLSAEIVTEMGKTFDLDNIKMEETKILEGLNPKNMNHMLVDSMRPVRCMTVDDDDEEEKMDDNEEEKDTELENVSIILPSGAISRANLASLQKATDVPSGLQQLNKDRQKVFKHMKKQRQKEEKLFDTFSETVTMDDSDKNAGGSNDVDDDDNYNFDTDFL